MALGIGSLEALFDVELWLFTCPCMAVNLPMYGCLTCSSMAI